MNREIKFRGKKVDKGELIFGSLIQREDSFDKLYMIEKKTGDYFYGIFQVEPKTIGQYTGLKDKNGKEIYEGDIVEYTSYRNCHNYIGKIVYKDCEFCIEVIKSTSFKGTSHLSLISDKGFTNNEIIGNVHENTEML